MSFLHESPLDPGALLARHDDPGHGGMVLFVGRVRDAHQGRAVAGLDYSAYVEMAEAEAAALLDEAAQRWPVRVTAAHRLGRLMVGDVAVVVVTSGAHRDACYQANRWVIDTIKARVPIWKLERYTDGTEAWVDPTAQASSS